MFTLARNVPGSRHFDSAAHARQSFSRCPMRIALIGPVFPYRGGISHHSNLLTQHMRQRGHNVDLISFSRQYPRTFYPSRSQEEPRESSMFSTSIVAEKMIDTINPISWIRTGRALRQRDYDLLVFKFWNPFFAPAFGTIARLARKRPHTRNLVICENIVPHERTPGDGLLSHFFLKACDLAITQSSTVATQWKQRYPDVPHVMLPHPLYDHFGPRISQEVARRLLGLNHRQIGLFFGFVRPYKGLERLLEAMPEIRRQLPDFHLCVVGDFFGSRERFRQILARNGATDRVSLFDGYVPNEQVAAWFSAADLVVLPYESATNSGVVQIAYNFAVPVVVTDAGNLSEVVIHKRTGFVIGEPTPSSFATALVELLAPNTRSSFVAAIIEHRKQFNWGRFVEGLEDLCAER
jgi:D-inositol-3-phosphate glycosyltransferase